MWRNLGVRGRYVLGVLVAAAAFGLPGKFAAGEKAFDVGSQPLLDRLRGQVERVLDFLRSKPPKGDAAKEQLREIHSEIASMVQRNEAEAAVAADLLVAQMLCKNGYSSTAITFLNQALFVAPRNESVLALLIECYINVPDLAEARKIVDYVFREIKPTDPAFHFLSGRLLLSEADAQGDKVKLLEAARDLEVALGLGFKERDHGAYWLVYSYKRLGMPEKALKEIRRLRPSQLSPKTVSGVRWCGIIGGLYADMGDWEKAIEYELQGLQQATVPRERLMLYCALGSHHKNAGNHKKAIEYARKVISSADADGNLLASAYCIAANSYRRLGKLDLSINHALKAVEQKGAPASVRQLAYLYLGQCYGDVGEREKSQEMLEKAMVLSPDNEVGKRAKTLLDEMNQAPNTQVK
jgi:tetratricopeptide (TPR) repeat protein